VQPTRPTVVYQSTESGSDMMWSCISVCIKWIFVSTYGTWSCISVHRQWSCIRSRHDVNLFICI